MTRDPASATPRLAPGLHGLVAIVLAAMACMMAALAVAISSGVTPPRVATPAHAATPPPALPRDQGAWPLVAIEVLLPHLGRPEPFPRAFAVAVALAASDEEARRLMLPLAAVAAEGAPSVAQLSAGFVAAAEAAALAELGFAPEAGWLARRVAGTVRFGADLGGLGGAGLSALREAARRLEAGDAAGAEAALAVLSPEGAAALAAWRDGLGRRIAADAGFAALCDLAIRRTHGALR